MSPQSIVCATCDATVPYGRLSCPACGELLASVAGAARPAKTRAATGRARGRAAPSVLMDVPPLRAAVALSETAEAAPEDAGLATEDAGLATEDAPATNEAVGPAPEDAGATFEATETATFGWDAPGWDTPAPDEDEAFEAPIEGSHAAASGLAAPGWEPPIFQPVSDPPAADAPFDTEAGADADTDDGNGTAARTASRNPSPVEWPADQVIPDASPVAWPADQAMPDASPEVARPVAPFRSIPDAPGAYVPPIVPAEPAGAPAPARAWAGQPAVDAAASKADAPRSSIAGDLLDATRVTEFVGWLAVAGSAMAAVGFLLPWGVSVIGASGIGYFDRWGLAGPFHLVVFGSLLALLALSLVRNPIALWLRVGVLGLGLGALLLGLTWPYLVGLSGTGPGAMVVAIGALVLAAAGVGALASDRHAHEDQPV